MVSKKLTEEPQILFRTICTLKIIGKYFKKAKIHLFEIVFL